MRALLSLLTDIAATYRLTKLVLDDRITEDLRYAIQARFPRDSKIAYFVGCPWCVSIWAGAVIFTLRKVNPTGADIVSGLLAASAVTGVVYTKGLDQ
jgi:hypothetical protein